MFNLANLIMSSKFLLKFKVGGVEYDSPEKFYEANSQYAWVQTLINTVQTVLVPILAVVSAAGIIWAVVLGINMARADSTDKREEAKKRLIGLAVGLVIMVVLIVFFMTFFDQVIFAFLG